MGVVVAQANHAVANRVVARQFCEFREDVRFTRGFGDGGGGFGLPQMLGHCLIHQLVKTRQTELPQHQRFG